MRSLVEGRFRPGLHSLGVREHGVGWALDANNRALVSPEDDLLDRLVASPALAGPELIFLRARIAQRRGDVSQAARLVTRCLEEMPGHQEYLDFALEVGAELPSRAREIAAERARVAEYLRTT